jgi:hypothetical protein
VQVNQSVQLNGTQLVNISSPLLVLGNLTVQGGGVQVIVLYNGAPVLNVTGDVILNGSLVLQLGPNITLVNGQFIVLGYAKNLTGGFNTVTLNGNGCAVYHVSPVQYSSTTASFGVVVESVSNRCSHSSVAWWVYLVAGTRVC